MSSTTLTLILSIHALGFILWIGSAYNLLTLLSAYPVSRSTQRSALDAVARAVGRAMDVGAALAILFGVGYLVATASDAQWPLRQGWMHVKLLLIAALLGLHAYIRIKLVRLSHGRGRPPGRMAGLLVLLLAVAIIALAKIQPF